MSGSHVDAVERRRIVSHYKSGLNMTTVGRIVGRSPQTVRRQLEKAEVPIRSNSVEVDPEQVIKLYETMSLRAVAKKTGVSYGTVHRIVTNAGKIRARGYSTQSQLIAS
jgi:DNA invertase Pin-like site-specific DNA recombinase